jgi:AcrR family transcriptional regulator
LSTVPTKTVAKPTRPRRTAAETRDHVLTVASELFYWEGIHATGIDRVAARAEVAPTTLYRLFASKDDLVGAYVEHSAALYREWLADATAPAVGGPRERIVGLFTAMAEVVRPELCRGCPFLMALAEFPDPGTPAHAHAVEVKAWVRDLLGGLTAELAVERPLTDPDALADQLALVMEGVYGSVQALGPDGPAARAATAAAALIDAAG